MKEFKVGDIVLCKTNYDCNTLIKNKFGKIIYIAISEHNLIGVEFFEYINGHDCNGKGKYNYCWNIDKKYLIKTNKYKLQKLLRRE